VYLGAVSAIFGLAILYLAGGETGVPERVALVSASGPVQSIIKGKSSIKFSLKGDARHFQHLSKSGALLPVHQELSGAGEEMVTVLYDPAQGWQPAFDDNAYHTVYEIRVSGRALLSYEQARDAWQADQGVGKWLGMAFLLAGTALVIFSRSR
jgi:hypothetical protein